MYKQEKVIKQTKSETMYTSLVHNIHPQHSQLVCTGSQIWQHHVQVIQGTDSKSQLAVFNEDHSSFLWL